MKKKNVIAVALALLCLTLQAQNVKQATWFASLGATVYNVYDSQLNIPLVQTSGSNLIALEPSTGEVLWKTNLAVR